jgi:hypothetical protein
MAEVIKFRVARKRVLREQEQQTAAENRIVHGRTKAERTLETARQDKSRRELDAHRRETGERE